MNPLPECCFCGKWRPTEWLFCAVEWMNLFGERQEVNQGTDVTRSPLREIEVSREEDLNLVREALQGCYGDDALRVAGVGMRIVSTLLRKNRDYGNSAFEVPVLAPGLSALEGIQTRMSDKVKRLSRLLAGNDPAVQESVTDSMGDLAGYSMLWVALKEKTDGKEIFGVGSASKAGAEVSSSVVSGGEDAGPASGNG